MASRSPAPGTGLEESPTKTRWRCGPFGPKMFGDPLSSFDLKPLLDGNVGRQTNTCDFFFGGGAGGEKMEKVGGLGGRGRSVGVIGSNVVIQRFNTLV